MPCTSCGSSALSREDTTGGLVCTSCGVLQKFDNFEEQTYGRDGPTGTYIHIGSSGSSAKAGKDDALKRTLQVSNLSPLLTVEELKQLYSSCGTVVECTITDSKHFAYIEYLKPEEATAALALNNMDVGGWPLNVEMAKSLPQKSAVLNSLLASSSLPMMMRQAVAMPQMQFRQALVMQQTLTAQQAANRAASMKSATELAAARAAEISKKLKADGLGGEETQTKDKSRSDPSPDHLSLIDEPLVQGQEPSQDLQLITIEGGGLALIRLYHATLEIVDLDHH